MHIKHRICKSYRINNFLISWISITVYEVFSTTAIKALPGGKKNTLFLNHQSYNCKFHKFYDGDILVIVYARSLAVGICTHK